jgi:hypothetical protein
MFTAQLYRATHFVHPTQTGPTQNLNPLSELDKRLHQSHSSHTRTAISDTVLLKHRMPNAPQMASIDKAITATQA